MCCLSFYFRWIVSICKKRKKQRKERVDIKDQYSSFSIISHIPKPQKENKQRKRGMAILICFWPISKRKVTKRKTRFKIKITHHHIYSTYPNPKKKNKQKKKGTENGTENEWFSAFCEWYAPFGAQIWHEKEGQEISGILYQIQWKKPEK